MRIKEFNFIREAVRKLAYSMEQLGISNIDHKKTQEEHLKLPRLLSSETPSSRGTRLEQCDSVANSMDIMLMKRMHHIRNSLDKHDPVETTLKGRTEATRKKEERIMELW